MTKAAPPPPKKSAGHTPRPRGGEARAIADLVPDVGRAAFRRFGFVQASVVTRWPDIVGAKFASVTAPRTIRFPVGAKANGTLEVRVDGPSATMIQHVIPEIIERVNRFFGYAAVSRIALSHGPLPILGGNVADRAPASAAGPALGASLRALGDAELATVLGALTRQLDAAAPSPKSPSAAPFSAQQATTAKGGRHDDYF